MRGKGTTGEAEKKVTGVTLSVSTEIGPHIFTHLHSSSDSASRLFKRPLPLFSQLLINYSLKPVVAFSCCQIIKTFWLLLPGKSHGWRSLVGCSPWGREESDMTERLHFHFSLSCIGEGNGNHSSVLAWRIPGMGEPGGLPSLGLCRVGHD